MNDNKEMKHTKSLVCRDDQIKTLTGLIRESPYVLPSCLFIYGPSGTGKSLVLSSVLHERNVRVCYANCIEFYSQKIIYESILHQMAGVNADKSSASGSCDNIAEFVHRVKEKSLNKQERYAFIFEHSERLRDCNINIFPALCRLQELCEGVNVCVVFSSRLPLDKFRVPMGILEPLVLHFPQYKKDEILEILILVRPECCLSEDSYKNYINLLLSVFYSATRNLPELKHLAELHLSAYCDPIQRGETNENDLRFLWKNIEPKFRKALSTVYLREVSSEQFLEMQKLMDSDSKDVLNKNSTVTKLELPYYSKFLLMSAYLASYNPPATDKRFFTKNHGKRRKTQATIKAKQRSTSQLTGPKSFPMDRMLAIFYSIIEDKVAPTSHIFTQISTLVSLRLMTAVTSEDPVGSPKYKSNVSLDFIRSIARTVNFDIIQYLYEFSS